MAARESAAALSFLVYVVLSAFFCSCRAHFVYSRQDIIDIGWKCKVDITRDFQKAHNIQDAIGRPAESDKVTVHPKTTVTFIKATNHR
ncbi:hypothetical protein ABVT39_016746 [Epinephelus coioides]